MIDHAYIISLVLSIGMAVVVLIVAGICGQRSIVYVCSVCAVAGFMYAFLIFAIAMSATRWANDGELMSGVMTVVAAAMLIWGTVGLVRLVRRVRQFLGSSDEGHDNSGLG